MPVLTPRFRGLILTPCIVILAVLPLAARHAPPPPPPPFNDPGMPPVDPDHMRGGPPMLFDDTEFMKGKLGLSDEQIQAIGRINKAYHDKMVNLRNKMAPESRRLKELLKKDNVDRANIRKVLQSIGYLQTEMRYQMILHFLDIENVLTPEQRNKMKEERNRHRPPHPDGDGTDD